MLKNVTKMQSGTMDSLVLCRDSKTVATLCPLLEGAGSTAQVCNNPNLAVEMLARWKFDAMFVDCDEIPEGADVLRALRAAPSSHSAVAFAIVDRAGARAAFQMGATFVLEKPVDAQKARTTLRAAYGLMLLARRRYYRRPISIAATYVRKTGDRIPVRTMNLSEGGAGLELPAGLEPADRGELIFELPGSQARIEACCEIVWVRDGRAGLRFLHIANDHLNLLREWIKESFQQEPGLAKSRAF